MRINEQNSTFIMIDIQEKFMPVISEKETLLKNVNILNKAAEILKIPLLVTEQYPKGLGNTAEEIYIPESAEKFTKTKFSIFENKITEKINELSKPIMILYGIEAHICLTQSALDGQKNGYHVFYVVDAVASRDPKSKEIAIRRLEHEGVKMISTEMLLFEILDTAKHPNFKEISGLVK